MVAEVDDITEYWRDDLVSFLLGRSFSFENALMKGGIPLRHIAHNSHVSMLITNTPHTPARPFPTPISTLCNTT